MRRNTSAHLLLSCSYSLGSLLLFLLFFSGSQWGAVAQNSIAPSLRRIQFQVGVILDMDTWIGEGSWSCISMAIEDFYAAHPNYRTRLVLNLRDSNQTPLGAASAALDLLKNVQVQAIIGPQSSTQAKFVMELGSRTHVPIISFSAKSPSLSSAQTGYFVRTALSDLTQAKAIASLVAKFQWRQVVPIFEDTEYGNGIVPYLVDEFQESDVSVPYRSAIPLSASRDQIFAELYKLKTMQTRVFVVHMKDNLGFQFFSNAKAAGMMKEGFVWIITYGLTDILDFMGSSATNVMQGVLGVKPYFRETKMLSDFKLRWRKRDLKGHLNSNASEPSAFGLWAYDTVWALAMAVENSDFTVSKFQNAKITNTSSYLANLGYSLIGSELLNLILNTTFGGMSGKFHLAEGQLQTSMLEIVNVLDNGKRRIGFWTPEHGTSRYINSTADLKHIIWPGESTTVPKGWEWPTSNKKKLRIGVPVKPGFGEFIDMNRDPKTNRSIGGYRGFCIEVFDAVMAELPYAVPYEYITFENFNGQSNGSYDDLVYQVYLGNFDAVVGDITIIANRSKFVDFTLPYTESGVSMVVPVKDDNKKSPWTFLRPMTANLWVASGAFFILTGFIVWVMEHRLNEEFRGPPAQQLGTIFYFSFSTLVFAHREKLVNNLSRVVVIIWVFVVLILTTSYTASLTSMLTVQRLQPTVTDLNNLIGSGYNVGYLNGSFVPGLLKQLKVDSTKLIAYNSPEEYDEALTKGSSNGGVAAIVDEIPYIKVFLSKYCGKYTMVGPTYKTDGFGFVFPRNSPLVPDVSRAILNVTEGDGFVQFEKKLYGVQTCPERSSDVGSNSLSLNSFWGLFLITGLTSTLALLLFLVFFFYENRHDLTNLLLESSHWRRIALLFKLYDKRDPCSHTFRDAERRDGHIPEMVAPYTSNGSQSPSSISNHTYGNFDQEDGTGTPLDYEGTPGREDAIQNPSPLSFAEMLNERIRGG